MAIPTFDLEFTRDGMVFDLAQVEALLAGLGGVTDLIVLAHGWNNDMQEARDLYAAFLRSVEGVREFDPDDRTFAICQVFWPSKKFADAQLIPGGGAVSATAANDAALDEILDALAHDPDRLKPSAAAPPEAPGAVRVAIVEQAKALARDLHSADSQERFVERLRSLLDPAHASPDDASDRFFTVNAQSLFADLRHAVVAPVAVGHGGAAAIAGADGSAASLKDLVDGVTAAARRLANFATYYQMKSRAGIVGSAGLAPILRRVRGGSGGVRIHLVGHSFGGRLVTAAALGLDKQSPGVTLTLLQAAYSHNGLSQDYEPNKHGFFRSILADGRVTGPIVITHTKNDLAVGIAYPLASRVAGQNAAFLGDQNDPYGGMGRNGAQHTPEVDPSVNELLPVGQEYRLRSGRVYNLRADRFIRDHGDVAGAQAAAAFLAAARAV